MHESLVVATSQPQQPSSKSHEVEMRGRGRAGEARRSSCFHGAPGSFQPIPACRQRSANQCIGETDQPLCTCTSAGTYFVHTNVSTLATYGCTYRIVVYGVCMAGSSSHSSVPAPSRETRDKTDALLLYEVDRYLPDAHREHLPLTQQQVRWTIRTYEEDHPARAPPVTHPSWRACGGRAIKECIATYFVRKTIRQTSHAVTLSLLARSFTQR